MIERQLELSDLIPVGPPQRVEVQYERVPSFLTEIALFNAIDKEFRRFKPEGIAPNAFNMIYTKIIIPAIFIRVIKKL